MGKASELLEKLLNVYEVSGFTKMTESEMDAIISHDLSLLTEKEIEDVESDKEDDKNEAKSLFPKAKMIKSMQALIKKYREQKKEKQKTLMAFRNDYAQAKDRKTKLAITKKRKAKQAELDKIINVINRANDQLFKLEDERKAFYKAKRAKAKSDKKAA